MTRLPRVLDSSLNEIKRLNPVSVSITEEIVPVSSATMVLMADESLEDRQHVELFTPNGSAGIFRAIVPQETYGNPTKSISMEHAICEVGDYIIKADIALVQKTLSQAVSQIFAYYTGSRWQIGTVISGSVKLEAKIGDNLLNVLSRLVSQVHNAMIRCDFTTTPWTINIVHRGSTVSAEGRLNRNVTNASVSRDYGDMCTRVFWTYTDPLYETTSVQYMDADTISTYGIIEKSISISEDYTQAQAEAVAQDYLNKHKYPRHTITISGIDFSSVTGETLDRFTIGKLYRLALPEIPENIEETIIRIQWDNVYDENAGSTLTLAEDEQDLISFINDTNVHLYSRTEAIEEEVIKFNEEYTSKFIQTKQYIDTEVQRAKLDADGKYIAKEEDFQTIDDLLAQALQDAEAAASTAAAGCISKTQTYQTADAIVQSAAAIAATDAGSKYIAKTAQYQTADAIVSTAESYTDTGLAEKISKTTAYDTVDKILNKALTDAQAAATTAASGCIAKTSTYQTATAIVNAAVATARTEAGNTYIAKTTQYQTANAIVQAAETYTDGVDNRLSGQISTMSDKIALVVTQSGGNNVIDVASIVAAINDAGSSVVIDADHIDLNGYVTIGMLSSLEDAIAAVDTKATNAKNEADGIAQQLQTGLSVSGPITATGLNVGSGYIIATDAIVSGTSLYFQTININGTDYYVCLGARN